VATPQDLLDQLDAEFHFSPFDPCPLNPKPTFDGLALAWPKTTFVNPPYSDVRPWIEKAVAEQARGKTVVMLVPARTNSKYWHELVFPHCTEIRFLQGNMKFQGHPGPGLPVPLVLLVFRGRKGNKKKNSKNGDMGGDKRGKRRAKDEDGDKGGDKAGAKEGNKEKNGQHDRNEGKVSYPYVVVAVQRDDPLAT
jgi:hypothetical protein